MPRLSVYLVRASFIYLLLGFTIGALMLANKGVMISTSIWSLLPLHIEFAFSGWMIQLTMGAAFWILPRFSKGAPRGDERFSWLAFLLLNTGIALVIVDVLLQFSMLNFVGRILEALGLVSFVLGNWGRIKGFNV